MFGCASEGKALTLSYSVPVLTPQAPKVQNRFAGCFLTPSFTGTSGWNHEIISILTPYDIMGFLGSRGGFGCFRRLPIFVG